MCSLLNNILDEIELSNNLKMINELDKEYIELYINENYKSSLNEMARINVDEVNGYFPYNKFNVVIFSNDHNPPHFHIIAEDWDIRVEIESGEILSVKHIGKHSNIYSFVQKNVKEWLKVKNNIYNQLTNQEVAYNEWKMNNDRR